MDACGTVEDDDTSVKDSQRSLADPPMSFSLSAGAEELLDDVLAEAGFTQSKGEARRAVKENSVSVNMEKVGEDFTFSAEDIIKSRFALLQRGKKNKFLLKTNA